MTTFIKTRGCAIQKGEDGHYYLTGVMSDNQVDRDGDRMDTALLRSWADIINREHINVHVDHKHSLEDTVGVWFKADVLNGKLITTARLEDPELNPKVKSIIGKVAAGETIGISIGGDLTGSVNEGRVRRITEATLYEASLVGIPANQNAIVEGIVYKSWQPLFKDSQPQVVQSARAQGRFLTDGQPDADKLLQTRSPMNPESKIAAEPGMSGSSEVFRTGLGQKIDLGAEDDPWNTANPSSTAKPTDGVPTPRKADSSKTIEQNYGLGAKLEEDGHVYLSDGSHAKLCDDWDNFSITKGMTPTPMTKGNIEKFLLTGLTLRKNVYDWPSVIALDFNGTISIQGRGGLIKVEDIKALQAAGKTVFIFTSSADADSKEAMRVAFAREGIIYTDSEDLLRQADIFVGDKKSDERRAGKFGIKFINIEDFDLGKLLSKSLDKYQRPVPAEFGGPLGRREDEEGFGTGDQMSPGPQFSEEMCEHGVKMEECEEGHVMSNEELTFGTIVSANRLDALEEVEKGDIYIVNGESTTDGLTGEGPNETVDRILYGDSKVPGQNPTPIRPTRSPTSSPLSQDTLKTEDDEEQIDDTPLTKRHYAGGVKTTQVAGSR